MCNFWFKSFKQREHNCLLSLFSVTWNTNFDREKRIVFSLFFGHYLALEDPISSIDSSINCISNALETNGMGGQTCILGGVLKSLFIPDHLNLAQR